MVSFGLGADHAQLGHYRDLHHRGVDVGHCLFPRHHRGWRRLRRPLEPHRDRGCSCTRHAAMEKKCRSTSSYSYWTVGFGSRVFSLNHFYFWIPLVAPILGGAVGGIAYEGMVDYHHLTRSHGQYPEFRY
ncbi:hypothetical protein F443_18361 [Phytophthora nicotianae P1569]|uniref:Aquaporin n=1 Tax=Phytophthora nicotianae P1569 TaxID=1317065 RepID=V9E859_PHYNI|nr:hypothetical protein F443_18361 [Phytophthora nicotianae P1569]